MRISIIRSRIIEDLLLPQVIEGTYWIKDFDINGNKSNFISLEAVEGKWKIINNNESYCIDDIENKIEDVYLETNKFYTIYNTTTKSKLKFYTSDIEFKNDSYMINNYLKDKITIGSLDSNKIIYKHLDDVTATIEQIENSVVLVLNTTAKTSVYINKSRVNDTTLLSNGDIIFINGLKIVYYEEMDNEVLKYIAENIKSNIRELEGAFNKIIAFSKLNKVDINLAYAEEALKDVIYPDKPKEITPSLIIDIVSEHFGVNPEDITSKKRNSEFVLPRQVVMYLCRELTDTSLTNIGRLLGKKDHTTVIHGINKITEEINTNENLKNNIEVIKRKINP